MDIYNPYLVDAAEMETDEKSWDTFTAKIAASSEKIKDILFLSSTTEFLSDLCGEFDFNDEQSANLSRIVRDVLFADLFINDMTAVISQKLNIDQQTAQQIRDRIVKELFAPAIEDIRKIQRDKFPDRVEQGSASGVPQSPAPPQMKNAPPVNQSNVIDLRNQS